MTFKAATSATTATNLVFSKVNLCPSAVVAALDNISISYICQRSASDIKFRLCHLEERQIFQTKDLLLHYKGFPSTCSTAPEKILGSTGDYS